MQEFHDFIYKYLAPYRWLVSFLSKISFPGNRDLNMAEVLGFFMLRLPDESITTKASAIAFNFFLAIFPTFIVLFTLIPFIPGDGLQQELLNFFEGAIPENAYDIIGTTLEDILKNKRSGLLSISFIVALYFGSNGFSSIMAALHPEGGFWEQKGLSVILLFAVSLMMLLAIGVSIGAELVLLYFDENIIKLDSFTEIGISILKWLILILLTYSSVALMYYTGTPKKKRLSFFSPGAALSTISIVLISYGYGFWVENFGQYNKLYGSLGALIVTMLWMYMCALFLMIWHVYNKTHAHHK